MSASQNQSSLNSVKFGPNNTSSKATPALSEGLATAAGHGDHPRDNADDSNASLSGSKVGPQQEDLDGEKMRAPGEGEVMDAQLDKKSAGWGEQGSLTSDLDRRKAEQKAARGRNSSWQEGRRECGWRGGWTS